jgi:hypothetical protein
VLVPQEARQASSEDQSVRTQTSPHVLGLSHILVPLFPPVRTLAFHSPVLLGKFGMVPYANSTFGSGSIVSASPPSPEPHTMATFGYWRASGSCDRTYFAVSVARWYAFGAARVSGVVSILSRSDTGWKSEGKKDRLYLRNMAIHVLHDYLARVQREGAASSDTPRQ